MWVFSIDSLLHHLSHSVKEYVRALLPQKKCVTSRRSFLQRTSLPRSASAPAFGATRSLGPCSAPQPYWRTTACTSPSFLHASDQIETVIAAHDKLPATLRSFFGQTTACARVLARGQRSHNQFPASSRGVRLDNVRSWPAEPYLRVLTLRPLACSVLTHRTLARPPRRTGHPCS